MISSNTFGVDITKIQEFTWYHDVQWIPYSHPNVEGIIHLRDETIIVVDLAMYLDFPASENPEHDLLIITESDQMNIAFHIHRIF